MTRSNIARTDSLARSSRPFETLDQQYKARGLELKAQLEQGKISVKEFGIKLAVLVAEYRDEKAGKLMKIAKYYTGGKVLVYFVKGTGRKHLNPLKPR